MSVPVTFTYETNRASAVIPVFQDKIVENVETFDVNIDIPSNLKQNKSRKARKSNCKHNRLNQ